MPDDLLIVPTILCSGSLHFASVSHGAIVQDVIDSLVALEEVQTDVLGDLQSQGWAIQRIRKEHNGRTWEEEELEALGDGESCCWFTLRLGLLRSFGFCLFEGLVARRYMV